MMQKISSNNVLDEYGKPAGGRVRGVGIVIDWQDGPLGRDEDRQEPNGAFVEGVIEAARQRIQWYNDNGYGCAENDGALSCLQEALDVLNARTNRRESQGVEGTHEGS